MAKSVMLDAGFVEQGQLVTVENDEQFELIDVMLGVSWGECVDPTESVCTCHPLVAKRPNLNYADAVGDLLLIDAKWGPSVSQFQIRTLRDPTAWGPTDVWRDAEKLHDDPLYAAQAALAIVEGGAKLHYWTWYKNGRYREHLGEDFQLHFGHVRADQWDA